MNIKLRTAVFLRLAVFPYYFSCDMRYSDTK